MRKKKMTRDIKILIVLVSLLIIISVVTFSFHIQTQANNLNNSSYNARKEDLQLKQAELEKAIIDLNSTLQSEKARQQALADQISSLNNQSPVKSKPSSSGSGSSAPTPAPAPTPPPVTRAS
jgi:predicted PurR-regulated permease PerM